MKKKIERLLKSVEVWEGRVKNQEEKNFYQGQRIGLLKALALLK